MGARTRIAGALAAAAVLTVGVGDASAHIQVTPTVVAPSDPVLFTVLVPGERDTGTVRVDLRLPPGLMPFSFEDVPGWKRRVVRADDGSAERIVWTGRAAPDGLVRFVFLAGTPERPTTLEWKALQSYAGGYVARWIGAPDADYPAAVTEVRADAPRQNAGGEGGGAAGDDDATGAATDATGAATDATGEVSAGDGPVRSDGASVAAAANDGDADWVARGLGIAALAVGLAVGGAMVVRRRGDRRS